MIFLKCCTILRNINVRANTIYLYYYVVYAALHYRIESGKSIRKVRSLYDDLVFDTIRYRKTQLHVSGCIIKRKRKSLCQMVKKNYTNNNM